MFECYICGVGKIANNTQSIGLQEFSFNWPDEHCFQEKNICFCQSCGSGMLLEKISDEELSSLYQKSYASLNYGKLSKAEIFQAAFYPRYVSLSLYLNSIVELQDNIEVLEIGSNIVSIAPALSHFVNHSFYYYDQMESPIISAYGGHRLGTFFSNSTIPDKQFDLIVSSHSLEHINPSSLDDFIRNIKSVLKSNGVFLVEVPNDVDRSEFTAPHTLFFTLGGLTAMFERHGFEVVSQFKSDQSDFIGVGENKPMSRKLLIRALISLVYSTLSVTNLKFKSWPRRLLERYILGRQVSKMRSKYDSRPFIRIIVRKKEPLADV